MIENSVNDEQVVNSDLLLKSMENLKNMMQNADIEIDDENYLQRYLYGTSFNVEEAFTKIKATREQMLDYRDWYRKDGPLKLKEIIDQHVRVVLPEYDKEGRPIYIVKNGNINPSTVSMLDIVAIDDVWFESMFRLDPTIGSKGLCVIMDIKDQNWKLTKWMQPDYVRQSLKKIENLPFKDYKVHVVNNSWWVGIALKLVWPFMPQKFKDMVKFHFDDMETFYEYIDRKVVPIEYGGYNEIKYSDLYESLYKRNDEIFKSFNAYRNITS